MKKAEQVDDMRDLRDGMKKAADVVARDAQGRVQSRTGRTRGAVRAVAGGNRAFVVGGKKTVPHYGWLDFGSRSPRSGQSRSTGPWANTGKGPARGRFIYPALDAREREVVNLVQQTVSQALNKLDL
ncbi:MAG: hypothetical protein ACOYXR_09295 [Nitrospirota bacterium]